MMTNNQYPRHGTKPASRYLHCILSTLLGLALLANAAAAETYAVGGKAVAKIVQNGKTYVDAKELAGALGLSYHWFPLQKMVILSRHTDMMRIMVNKEEAVFQNSRMNLGYAPIYQDGKLWVSPNDVTRVFAQKKGTPEPAPTVGPETPATEPEPTGSPAAPEPPTPPTPPPPPNPDPPSIARPEPGSGAAPTVTPRPEPPPSIVVNNEPEQGSANETEEEGPILKDVRKSVREDETRVVLEFTGPTGVKESTPETDVWRLSMPDCRNVMPKKKTNLNGRDARGLAINSGSNRKGLIFTFDLHPGGAKPTYEKVDNPFRVIVRIPLNKNASATAKLATTTTTLPPTASTTAGLGKLAKDPKTPGLASEPTAPPVETVAEYTREVPAASLTQDVFRGRRIVIDAAHGGNDTGATYKDLVAEKTVVLGVAQRLEKALRQRGLTTFMVRGTDKELSASERLNRINRANGDLLISLHAGGSLDSEVQGPAVYAYDNAGVAFDTMVAGAKLSPQLVYNEWCRAYRFDLARYLARSIHDRIVADLGLTGRGNPSLPMLSLRFTNIPGVLVELGMVTNPDEAKRLGASGFQKAAAESIANGVVDFFNALKLGGSN